MLVYFEVNFGIFETSSGFFVDISFGFFVGIVDFEVTPVFGSGWILGTFLRVGMSPLKKKALNTLQGSSPFLELQSKPNKTYKETRSGRYSQDTVIKLYLGLL